MSYATKNYKKLSCILAIATVSSATLAQPFMPPATGVEINNLTVVPFAPPPFGPVLRVTTPEGQTRLSITGYGDIRFERGATLSFDDLVVGRDGRMYVPVWVKGNLLLLEVHPQAAGSKLHSGDE